MGFLGVSVLAITLGIFWSYIISIVLTLAYFIGFIVLIIKVRSANNELLKRIHFNLCLVLRNENDNVYSKYGIKLRPGFISKWIEFHWANPYEPSLP